MVDKLNAVPESEQKKSPDNNNKEDDLRFEKQELNSLRLSIKEKNDASHEIIASVIDKKEGKISIDRVKKSYERYEGLPPMHQEALQKRKESAQSVVTMVQDAKNDAGIVGVLGSWAERVLHGIDV